MTRIQRKPLSAVGDLGMIQLPASTETLVHTNNSQTWEFVQLVMYNSDAVVASLPTITIVTGGSTEVVTVGMVTHTATAGDKGVALPIALFSGGTITINPLTNANTMVLGWVE